METTVVVAVDAVDIAVIALLSGRDEGMRSG